MRLFIVSHPGAPDACSVANPWRREAPLPGHESHETGKGFIRSRRSTPKRYRVVWPHAILHVNLSFGCIINRDGTGRSMTLVRFCQAGALLCAVLMVVSCAQPAKPGLDGKPGFTTTTIKPSTVKKKRARKGSGLRLRREGPHNVTVPIEMAIAPDP